MDKDVTTHRRQLPHLLGYGKELRNNNLLCTPTCNVSLSKCLISDKQVPCYSKMFLFDKQCNIVMHPREIKRFRKCLKR